MNRDPKFQLFLYMLRTMYKPPQNALYNIHPMQINFSDLKFLFFRFLSLCISSLAVIIHFITTCL